MTAFWIDLPNASLRSVGTESVGAGHRAFLGGQSLCADLTSTVATIEDDFDRPVLATETLDLAIRFRQFALSFRQFGTHLMDGVVTLED